jgi:hypothetical protein
MSTRLRGWKPVGVTTRSLKFRLSVSASTCAARFPPVPILVGLVALVESAPGEPPVPTACCNAATSVHEYVLGLAPMLNGSPPWMRSVASVLLLKYPLP